MYDNSSSQISNTRATCSVIMSAVQVIQFCNCTIEQYAGLASKWSKNINNTTVINTTCHNTTWKLHKLANLTATIAPHSVINKVISVTV